MFALACACNARMRALERSWTESEPLRCAVTSESCSELKRTRDHTRTTATIKEATTRPTFRTRLVRRAVKTWVTTRTTNAARPITTIHTIWLADVPRT